MIVRSCIIAALHSGRLGAAEEGSEQGSVADRLLSFKIRVHSRARSCEVRVYAPPPSYFAHVPILGLRPTTV
jgi:hypothetical protein